MDLMKVYIEIDEIRQRNLRKNSARFNKLLEEVFTVAGIKFLKDKKRDKVNINPIWHSDSTKVGQKLLEAYRRVDYIMRGE